MKWVQRGEPLKLIGGCGRGGVGDWQPSPLTSPFSKPTEISQTEMWTVNSACQVAFFPKVTAIFWRVWMRLGSRTIEVHFSYKKERRGPLFSLLGLANRKPYPIQSKYVLHLPKLLYAQCVWLQQSALLGILLELKHWLLKSNLIILPWINGNATAFKSSIH